MSKKFTPINGHIEIKVITEGGIVARQNEKYEERGIVISVDPVFSSAFEQFPIKLGDTIYFDGWLASKYTIDDTEEFRYLVKYDDIRGIERETHEPLS